MKELPPGYMSDIQGKINVFTANLHPLILLLGIIKGFSDTILGLFESPVCQCVCVRAYMRFLCAFFVCVMFLHYMLFVCGRGGDREGGYHS